MSVFYHPITVLSASGEEAAEVDALVDTGPTYLWLPRLFLERLGHRPVASRRMTIATGGEIERGVAPVAVRLNGEAWAVPCVLGTRAARRCSAPWCSRPSALPPTRSTTG